MPEAAPSGHTHGAAGSNPTAHPHDGHAHTRNRLSAKASRFSDINVLGVLVHILGDALNSVAVSEYIAHVRDHR